MIYSIKRTIYPLAALLMLAACTQDEMPDNGNILPEGKYPLEIASVTMDVTHSQQPWNAPQTRVSENPDGMSSKWDGGEVIHVKLGNQETTYEVTDANGSLNLTGEQLYWTKRTDNVTAWYPENDTINLANQSTGLAYVLQATADNASYENPVTLNFSHSLAKVRVVFSEESTADLTNASVSILAPTTCTVNEGNVEAGSTTDYIPMHKATYGGKDCYEANVTPNLTLKDNAFLLVVEGKTVKCSTTQVTTQAGLLHIITLTVKGNYTVVDISSITGTEYTVSGNVHLKGNGNPKDLKLKVEDGSKLLLEDVILKPTATGNAVTCNGNATIRLIGKNEIAGVSTNYYDEGSGILINQGTLTIDGSGELVATGIAGKGCGIGANNGASIIINGGKITATSSNPYDGTWGNPGIGVIAWSTSYCGDITINGGHITAQGGPYAAGIGTGVRSTCGNITIQGENTIVTSKKGNGVAEDIGRGDSGACGTITFRGGATVNGTKYN